MAIPAAIKVGRVSSNSDGYLIGPAQLRGHFEVGNITTRPQDLPVGSSISFWEGVLVIHGDHLDQCQTSGSGSAHVAATPMQLDEPVVLDAAAQTRIVSAGQNLVDPRKSVRPFKGIICADVSEFESYMPSHAVGLSASLLTPGNALISLNPA
jgi:hypothetical protein